MACVRYLIYSTFTTKPTNFFVNVAVHFYPWFKCYFPLFWGMVLYDHNEFETKENKI